MSKRDAYHSWAAEQAARHPPPWSSCEAVASETFHLLGGRGAPALTTLLRRDALLMNFSLTENLEPVLKLLDKYRNVPISLADACLVRMTETLNDPFLLTTDEDFRVYRRHGRQVIPCVTPVS
ncbi:MAG: PIN domain-containing protein [Acidobacteria bacterium]|nr:PIN domain-containing protein [Acidobacteriota bacterium]